MTVPSAPVPLRVAAVIPTLDEEAAIGGVVAGLLDGIACCVLVVDGGSRDATAAVATAAGARLILEPRRGYGRACRTGTELALAPAADGHNHVAVAFLDGDGSCDPADIGRLAAALADADVVLGRRPGRLIERGAMPWHARLGNTVVAALASLLTGRRVHDLPPTKVLRAGSLRRLALDHDGYGWTTQLVARALADRGLVVHELAVRFRPRQGGTSKVSGSPRASAAAAWALIATTVRERQPAPVLALMAKAPGAGHAKTRLAREIGEELAASAWAACLADTAAGLVRAADRSRASTVVMVPRIEDVAPIRDLVGRNWTIRIQDSAGLAGALVDVFLAAFDAGADRAIAVAGDNPSLHDDVILAALQLLERASDAAVLGPTLDGGYHLIGLRWPGAPPWWPAWLRGRRRRALERRLRGALEVVRLGGTTARAATQAGLAVAGWRPTAGQSWPDIDTLADLLDLAPTVLEEPEKAPRTAAWLARHRAVIEARSNEQAPPDSTRSLPPPEAGLPTNVEEFG